MGDEVTLDFDGSVDGVPFDGGKGRELSSAAGRRHVHRHTLSLRGAGGGDPPGGGGDPCDLPQQYTPELAGKAAVFRVKAHRIVRRSMPELNDEFARAQGFSDAAALRRGHHVRPPPAQEAQARDAYADAPVRQVLDGMEVRVPDSMVESQLTGLLHELESRLMSQEPPCPTICRW